MPLDPLPVVAAPAGNASFVPGVIRLLTVMLLAASNAARRTWLRLAIALSESPALTVYVAVDVAVDDDELEVEVGAAAGVTAPAGSANVMPGVIKLEAVIPLAASNAGRATLARAAIALSESPALTVYVAAAEPFESF